MMRVAACFMLIVVVSCAHHKPARTARPELPAALRGLSAAHPRLLVYSEDFTDLQQRVLGNRALLAWSEQLRTNANRFLLLPTERYDLPDGKRLLASSNRVLERIQVLATAYRLFGDKRYADRAWRELDAAAHFPDWNPKHFLDTAEMTHAFAIGYDWLFDYWTPAQRKVIADAIVTFGLRPGLEAYRSAGPAGWWTRVTHNWNQVCNGGLVMGALAIADEQPALAASILNFALASLPRALAVYAPDGALVEGPAYWAYGTSYTALAIASLQSALGRDFGLTKTPGLVETAEFPIYMTGPSGAMFSFGDTDPNRRASSLPLWWLARVAHRPMYATFAARVATGTPYDMLLAPSLDGADTALAKLSLDKYWRRLEAVTLRSSWDDPNALFVAFKAGSNGVNHAHLDTGTFAIEALGEQWAIDLGTDDYNLDGYFDQRRWQFYRTRAEGHNTLVIEPGADADQAPNANTRISTFKSSANIAFAIADLTSAYRRHATSVRRGVSLVEQRSAVIVQDEVDLSHASDVWWFMHTRATVAVSDDSRTAELTQSGKHMYVRVLAPKDAVFSVLDARPLPGSPNPAHQNANADVRKLALHLAGVTSTKIVVAITPYPTVALTTKDLDSW
jgi:hypothetical protein